MLSGKDICAEAIGSAGAFLTGACSCQVKEMNPGVNLLLAADWEALLDDAKCKEPKIPEIPIGQ